jgi:hypothetical protein
VFKSHKDGTGVRAAAVRRLPWPLRRTLRRPPGRRRRRRLRRRRWWWRWRRSSWLQGSTERWRQWLRRRCDLQPQGQRHTYQQHPLRQYCGGRQRRRGLERGGGSGLGGAIFNLDGTVDANSVTFTYNVVRGGTGRDGGSNGSTEGGVYSLQKSTDSRA